MKHCKAFGAALIATGLFTLSLHGQVPSLPSAPAVPGGIPSAPAVPGGVPSVPGAPTAPSNIFTQLFPSAAQLQQCKAAFCAHPIGQMINSMIQPLTLYSGGLITPCCPTSNQPNPADLAAGAETAEGAVAAIKADEAGAAKRRAEMRYLGTVDCHYWPEAESALIKGLRTDKNECVREEAAMSMGKGCCCTKKIMEALAIAISGSEKDGHPGELSERVKVAALKGLNHCLICYRENSKGSEVPKEKPVGAASKPASPMLPSYYVELEKVPLENVVAEARQAVAKHNQLPNAPIPPGRQTVADIMTVAATGQTPRNNIATEATANSTLKAVPAGSPTPPPAPAAPPPNTDLLHFFKTTTSSRPSAEPPRAAGPAIAAPPTTQQTAVTSVPVNSSLPPTGNRDLWHVFQNSIGGN